MKRVFWLFCLLSGSLLSYTNAQDQSNFTQFYLNPYLLNPSFAGIDGQSSFSLIYRRQWMNIDGGPAIANVSLHTPVNAKTSVGMSITNDKKGVLSNTSMLFSLGLNIAVADHSALRFGISAGGSWNTIDLEKFDSNTDPALGNLLDQHASLAGNAGISFHHKQLHFGLAMPSVFSPSYVSTDAFTVAEVKPFESLVFHATNRFYFNNNQNVFEPYAVYRLNTGLPSQFEFAGIVHLNHVIWAGASYKQDFGISAVGGIKLQHVMAIGASYSLKNSGINELNSPSFEVSLNLLFGKHKKGTHVYSFVNTVKEKEKKPRPSAAEVLAKKKQEEEKKKAEALKKQQDLARQEEARKEEERKRQEALAAAKAEEERKKQEEAKNAEPVLTQTTPTDTAARQHNPRMRNEMFETFKTPEELSHEQEQERLKRLEVHAENPTEHHDEHPAAHPNAERHEFVKRGGHNEELDVADYVIGGVFKSDANAKHFTDGLVKLGFKADYGHLTEKNLWYVYLFQTTDIDQARAERDRVRKMKLLKDAWLLTVHH